MRRRRHARPLCLWPGRARLARRRRSRSCASSARRACRAAPATSCATSRRSAPQSCFVSVVGNDPAGRELNRLIGRARQCRAACSWSKPAASPRSRRATSPPASKCCAPTARAWRRSAPSCRADFLRLVGQRWSPTMRCVVLSDYAKGVLGDGIAAAAHRRGARRRQAGRRRPQGHRLRAPIAAPASSSRTAANSPRRRGMPVDTRGRDRRGGARALIAHGGFGAVLVPAGEDGMILVEAEGAVHRSRPRRARSTTSPAPATR